MFILVAKVSFGQTKQDSVISFSQDSVLNEFIVKWIGKPYKLGGKTENGIDCSQFNKRLYKDVYGLNLENVCYRQWNQTQRIKIVDLKIENKSLDNYKYNTESKLKASENIISNLKQEITNMRLIIEELKKQNPID